MKSQEMDVQLPFGPALRAVVAVPEALRGMVLVAHGSGSSRHSPRNQAVAEVLQAAGLGTVLLDLLTPGEQELDQATGKLRFDVARLARRLAAATGWVRRQVWGQTDIGYFGASTGAAAALLAATQRAEVRAIVSRGGRPDLTGPALGHVLAPTLLIVGGADPEVLALNREALASLRTEKHLVVVPGATHLFAEPGALAQVAALARDWFLRHLGHSTEIRPAA
ncbi:MAG: dienelactone hydrolase family protein [Terriglobales bacterium]